MTKAYTNGKRLGLTALAIAATALFVAGPAAANNDPTGVWIDNTGRGAVEITECGKALCGKVVWVKSEKDREGCGEQIIGNVKPDGKGLWDSGWIYSPEHGRKYDVELKPVGSDKLRVVGYAGIRLFSETYYWKRAPADLARCDAGQTAAAADGKPLADTSLETASITPAQGGVAAAGGKSASKGVGASEPAKLASAADGEVIEDDPAPKRRGSGSGSGDIAGLPVGKYLKRTGNTCKLNTPWFKVNFDCKDF